MIDREAIYSALFTRLSDAFPGYWATREVVPADRCQKWPALLVIATDGTAHQSDEWTTPPRWTLRAEIALYIQRKDSRSDFEPFLFETLGALEDALAPQASEASFGRTFHTTLGDIVQRAWIVDYEITHHPGDQRAAIFATVEMLSP